MLPPRRRWSRTVHRNQPLTWPYRVLREGVNQCKSRQFWSSGHKRSHSRLADGELDATGTETCRIIGTPHWPQVEGSSSVPSVSVISSSFLRSSFKFRKN